MIDRLDRFALARKRAITVPLVREFLQATPGEYSGHPEPPASGSNDMP